MNKKELTEVISHIQPEYLEEALSYQKKRSFRKPVMILVTCLLILGIFVSNTKNEGFIQTVDANKLNTHSFVRIGSIVPIVSTWSSTSSEDGGNGLEGRTECAFRFQLQCTGRNIESIHYKINGAYFCIKKGYDKVYNIKKSTEQFEVYEFKDYVYCESYDVKFDNQPGSTNDIIPPICIYSYVDTNDKAVLWLETLEGIFNDTIITVTFHYKDGTTKKKEILLECKGSFEEVRVYAKIKE